MKNTKKNVKMISMLTDFLTILFIDLFIAVNKKMSSEYIDNLTNTIIVFWIELVKVAIPNFFGRLKKAQRKENFVELFNFWRHCFQNLIATLKKSDLWIHPC